MPALTFGCFAARAPRGVTAPALLMSLLALSSVAPVTSVVAAETDGEWKCAQAEDTGKWSCARDGVSATDLAGPASSDAAAAAEQIAAEVKPVEASPAATAAPVEIDPYEARARAAVETVDAPAEPVAETPAPDPEPAASSTLVDEPVAAAPVTEPAPAPAPEREPEPIRVDAPAPEPAPVAETVEPSSGDVPAYQALAYVPEKPTSLLELPPNFWVAQLMAVSSKEFLETYAEEHNLRGLSAARIASGDRLFFVLILGIYDTKDKAQRAITNMPPPYHKYKPLLRTLGSLQDAMRKADQMTGSADF